MATKPYTGLTNEQVEAQRAKFGANVLTPPARKSLLAQFIEKFNDPLIKILLVALLLSVGISCYEFFGLNRGGEVLFEPVGIFVAIILATLVGFLVEVNANKKFDLLNKVNDDIVVKVTRNGKITQIPRRDVVVGDIVMLDTGEKVPADGTLLDSVSLSVDESSLTGEMLAHKSHVTDDSDNDSTYGKNVLLRGSNVLEGHGVMQVTAVGDSTEYGKVFADAQSEPEIDTPLTIQLNQLGRWISWGSYVAGALIVIGRVLVYALDGVDHALIDWVQYCIETIMLAVTLLVVSVPEGLPMSITLSLALSMRRMLQSNNLVRRMHACETMGATTMICTDKTGTLTQNQMRVAKANFFGLDGGDTLTGNTASQIVTAAIADNSTAFLDSSNPDKTVAIGNPTEGALLLWLNDNGIDYLTIRQNDQVEAQQPFSTERKYMATVVSSKALGRILLVKGASEIINNYCSTIEGGKQFSEVEAELHAYQNKAMRTLGFAYKQLDTNAPLPFDDKQLTTSGLTFIGVVAISDPVREEVPQAIKSCIDAGIGVKIVTGDTPGTAKEIGRQVGLWQDGDDESALISGVEFGLLSDKEAAERIKKVKIMSRARPDDKARLVSLLQQQGEVVAVTGDGTNDAPALNAAQVGLSMGDGTSVAKEVSDITITDNSFGSINKAVMWGRSLYKNIQRFIIFQLTVNVAACLLVGVCSFFSEQSPLSVTQMLWVNLIMDTFAALALASLPPSGDVMRDKPRASGSSIITRSMTCFFSGIGIVFTIVMILLFTYLMHHNMGEGGSFISTAISPNEVAIYFSTFVFLQFWNLFNAKSFNSNHHSSFHDMRHSKIFFGILAVIFFGQIIIVQFGGPMFNVVSMTFEQWVVVILATSPVMIVGELYHAIMRAKDKKSAIKTDK